MECTGIPYPMAEETAKGVQRTYKDKNLHAIMKEHFETSVSAKQRQLKEIEEVKQRRGPREASGNDEEFPKTELQTNMIDDTAGDGDVREKGT